MTIDIVKANVFGQHMEVGASGHMMIDITDFEGDTLLKITDCQKFRLLPDATAVARRELIRVAGEMEFARA
eukprot:4056448-Heterocapsa_arctica.AAC.1